MKKAHKEALEMQQRLEEEEEQGGRGERARKPKPQAEEVLPRAPRRRGAPRRGRRGNRRVLVLYRVY